MITYSVGRGLDEHFVDTREKKKRARQTERAGVKGNVRRDSSV